MKKLTFDEFTDIMNDIAVPAQRIGIFNLKISNAGRYYIFEGLKLNASFNPDNFGFGLNHYGWLNLPKQKYNRSRFHDEEDVSIDFSRDDFQWAIKVENRDEMMLVTKTWSAQINWLCPTA